MLLKAVPIAAFDFSPYGVYYAMERDEALVSHTKTAVYDDHMTRAPLIDTPGHLGLTVGAAAPYTIASMEKHDHTQEAIFCMKDRILLCVAAAHGDEAPKSEDIRAVILAPGDAVVLERNVWHDACHGLGAPAAYYYLAKAGAQPAAWLAPEGAPVTVEY